MAALREVFEAPPTAPDYVKAEHYYGKALLTDPTNEEGQGSRKRTLPLVEQIDQASVQPHRPEGVPVLHIPETHPGLRRLKKEHYFRYVNAIEGGNTLDLAQTRAILETRIAVGGKSLLEHNEVLGLDAALMFLNSSLLRKPGPLLLSDLLEIHRRVLGYVDCRRLGGSEYSGVIADFRTPPANLVPSLMADFLNWLNSEDTAELHPVEVAALAPLEAGLLMNLILMRSGYPPAIVRVEERAIYYQLIKEANEGDATIDEFLLTAQRVSDFEAAESGASLSLAKQSEDCKPRLLFKRSRPPPPSPSVALAASAAVLQPRQLLQACPVSTSCRRPFLQSIISVRATDRGAQSGGAAPAGAAAPAGGPHQTGRRGRPAPARLRQPEAAFSPEVLADKERRRQEFHDSIFLYMQRYGRTRRGHVEFIEAMRSRLQELGVHKDLQSYKALLDVFPKEVMRVRTMTRPSLCCDTMNEHGVMPDTDMGLQISRIFGTESYVMTKFQRMMYWDAQAAAR
uniref:ECSIT domain-containing protein n=1 Tax=Macrostomum lignano TaxID=282301 RepID=A0A1I8JSE0_9PLAT